MFGRRFGVGDLAQQVLGGMFVAGPFVVTEEVWVLAQNAAVWQGLLAAGVVLVIGYFTLYGADENRDPEKEARTFGVPNRFVSAIIVSYASVIMLVIVFGTADTFATGLLQTVKAVQLITVFSVIGATTADSLF